MKNKISFRKFAKKLNGKKVKYCGIPLNFDFFKPVEVSIKIKEQPEYGILITRLSNNIKMFYREEESEVEYDEDQKRYILYNFKKKHFFYLI